MFQGNPNLRGPNEPHSLTMDQVKEYVKCSQDPIYFIENYIMIDTLWQGDPKIIKFKPEPYQVDLIMKLHENRFVIGKLSRQVGKSTALNAYAVWCTTFKDGYKILSAAHKAKAASNNMKTFKLMIERLPTWIQVGVSIWNMERIEFENGSLYAIETTTEDSGRSGTYSLVILDEFAFVDDNIANEFYGAVYPTIASGKTTKLAIISTPNGMNTYYEMWTKASLGKSPFKTVEIKWNDPPNRDEQFKQDTIAATSLAQWLQEFECIFAGSEHSLIDAQKLTECEIATSFEEREDGLITFFEPEMEKSYFMTVDVARGREGDNSAFVVVDVTQIPYQVVCTYANNEMPPMQYPNLIQEIAEKYNQCPVLIELNDAGQEVADLLTSINEYWNVMHTSKKDGITTLGGEFDKFPGITTTGPTKSKGCTALRALVENKALMISDFRIKKELSNFTLQGGQYKASPGNTDDLAMALVIFSWASTQDYFKELTESDIREKLYAKYESQLEEELVPAGYGFNEQDEHNFQIHKESAWLFDSRWYILMKDEKEKRLFLAGKDSLLPEQCHYNYISFDKKLEAEIFVESIKRSFKDRGYTFMNLVPSEEVKQYFDKNVLQNIHA